MALSESEVQEMLLQAQEQSGGGGIEINTTVKPEVVKTIKEGDIIAPKEVAYKTPEELRDEALALALETERLQEITTLEARLVEDANLTPEERLEIEATLKTLKPVEEVADVPKTETTEEVIARLKKEVEELKNPKQTNPLAQIEAKVTEAGIDIKALQAEYVYNGDISEESLASLTKAGFDKVAIDAYIETKRAQGEAEATKIVNETVGSFEVYDKMAKWMRETMTPEAIDAYDAGINTPHAKIYIENMYAKYTKATTPPTIIRNNGYVREGGDTQVGFKSVNEQNLAMADVRYGRDAKYTSEVRNKVMHSTYS